MLRGLEQHDPHRAATNNASKLLNAADEYLSEGHGAGLRPSARWRWRAQVRVRDVGHLQQLEGAMVTLGLAETTLGSAKRVDAGLVGRLRARLSRDNVIREATDGNSHQGSIALARAHLEAAGAHNGPSEQVDQRTWRRARARRANLARNAQAGGGGHRGNEIDPQHPGIASDDGAAALARLLGEPEQLRSPTGISVEHNCLTFETAAAEMAAVASQNARVKDAVYHVVLSWPASETPTDEEAFACGRHALGAVGMEAHQYVFAVHRDTAHSHLHIAVNRVHPETLRAVYPDRDFFKLDRAMRELEMRYGWKHDKGPYAVFERQGKQVIDWASKAPETKGKQPTRARDMERHADAESLFSYVRGSPRDAVIELLEGEDRVSWQALHGVLAQYGLGLREKGQGFAIFDAAGDVEVPVKASDMHEQLSKHRLVARLGNFELPVPDAAEPAQTSSYDRFKPLKRDPVKRETARAARAEARRGLRERYEDYRRQFVYRKLDPDEVRQRYAALRATSRRKRDEVKTGVRDPATRKALYSVIAFETLRAREVLRAEIAIERNGLRADPGNRRLSFRSWVEQEAAQGDAAAISRLRGWAYSDQRQAAKLAKAANSGAVIFAGRGGEDPIAAELGANLIFSVRRDGTVMYRSISGDLLVTDHGARIEVHGTPPSSEAMDTALRLARQKFGDDFSRVAGDDDVLPLAPIEQYSDEQPPPKSRAEASAPRRRRRKS